MGSKQTKLEGEYQPQTPQFTQQPITVQTDFGSDLENVLDPRSPRTCRTPLNEIVGKNERIYQQVSADLGTPKEQPMGLLRKRFFKGFTYSLNDPRSPSVNLNRTPLVFDETVNLDDTFSDLFVETKAPQNNFHIFNQETPQPPQQETENPPADQQEEEIEKKEEEEEELKTEEPEEEVSTPKIPKTNPQETIIERDPRSPSIGVERTPIILNDDEAPDEEDMIETILSTLSLNKKAPANKPLERIRNKKKTSAKPTMATTAFNSHREMLIYEDRENSNIASTPTKSSRGLIDSPAGKRTPLTCLKNNPLFKSKSVEVSAKTIKARLPLTSFDDTLHKITPVKKILRYSNMENIENSFEF